MKLSLTLHERLILFSMIVEDKTASLADWKIINQAKEVLSLSEEDHKLYGVKVEQIPESNETSIKWKNKEEASKEKEYDIPQRAYEMIVRKLREKDKTGGLPEQMVSVASKVLEE